MENEVTPPPAVTIPTTQLEAWLVGCGFKSTDKRKWAEEFKRQTKSKKWSEARRRAKIASAPRFTYFSGTWRVLTPNHECPWVTLQKTFGGNIHWYVDFPPQAPHDAVLAFMNKA